MADSSWELMTLYTESHGEALDGLRYALGGGEVGGPDATGVLDIQLAADTREAAVATVRDAIASVGADDHFTFPETTRTRYLLSTEER